MNPVLRALEHRLGPVDTWPSYILRFIFLDLPSPTVVKKLTAFFRQSSPYRPLQNTIVDAMIIIL
jgi:hypothetical protein